MFEQNITLGPGTGTFTSHTFEILIILGVAFLLGLWLGWILWSRYKQQAEKMRLEHDSLTATAATLRTETETLKAKVIDLEAGTADLQNRLKLSQDENTYFGEQMRLLEERMKRLTEENRRLSMELGLAAVPDLSDEPELELTTPSLQPPDETPPAEEIPDMEYGSDTPDEPEVPEAMIDANGELEPVEPEGTMLAGMQEPEEPQTPDAYAPPAEEENTAAVEELPDQEPTPTIPEPETEMQEVIDPPVLEETSPIEPSYFFAGPHDDLKVVEGIGPKIEEVLFKNGIQTYTDLARTPVHQLKEILMEAGPRFVMHDPGTWSAQALLAANGEWDNLKAYQEFLNAGKRPK